MSTPTRPSGRDLKAMLTGGRPPAKPDSALPATHTRLLNWLGKPTRVMSEDEIFQELFKNGEGETR